MIELLAPTQASVWCTDHRQARRTIGFVPTMGALHAGHLSLAARARAENDVVCASIFVNPLQFDNAHDLARYPHTMEADLRALTEAECDMVFSGQLLDFFPDLGLAATIPIRPAGPFGHGLEGASRPGHLDGVATIVEKLFAIVGDCTAYFGEKDFQQVMVVNTIAAALCQQGLHVQVRPCPTIRAADGLALSSRNRRLNVHQRALATKLYQSLSAAKNHWQQGLRALPELEAAMARILDHPEITIDYATVRAQQEWPNLPPAPPTPRAFVAAEIGAVRLIDNLGLDQRTEDR